MQAFRNLIYGLTQFFLVILIVAATIFGGIAAHNAARFLPVVEEIRATVLVVAAILGALGGFAISAVGSAITFALIEIARNTRPRGQFLPR